MPSALKLALEDLLRSRRLQDDGPPLRGEDRRLRALHTGIEAVDELLQGGFPRGQLSEVYGPASSGRTSVVLSLVSRTVESGALAAWVDPGDRLDPASAAAMGVDLERLFWLRGGRQAARALADAVAALGTLLGSGLFDLVVFDVAGEPDLHRLPGATWIRLQRLVEDTPTAVVLIGEAHVAQGPGGAVLRLEAGRPSWRGPAGPGRLLAGLGGSALAGRHALRRAPFQLDAV